MHFFGGGLGSWWLRGLCGFYGPGSWWLLVSPGGSGGCGGSWWLLWLPWLLVAPGGSVASMAPGSYGSSIDQSLVVG